MKKLTGAALKAHNARLVKAYVKAVNVHTYLVFCSDDSDAAKILSKLRTTLVGEACGSVSDFVSPTCNAARQKYIQARWEMHTNGLL